MPGIDDLRKKTLSTDNTETSKVNFQQTDTDQIEKDCEKEVSTTMQAANIQPTSGYRAFLEKTVLRMLFGAPAEELPELFLKYFITVSALSCALDNSVDHVKEQLKHGLDCHVKQLLAMLKETVPAGPSSADIVAKQTIEVINAICYDKHWTTPKFWF